MPLSCTSAMRQQNDDNFAIEMLSLFKWVTTFYPSHWATVPVISTFASPLRFGQESTNTWTIPPFFLIKFTTLQSRRRFSPSSSYEEDWILLLRHFFKRIENSNGTEKSLFVVEPSFVSTIWRSTTRRVVCIKTGRGSLLAVPRRTWVAQALEIK